MKTAIRIFMIVAVAVMFLTAIAMTVAIAFQNVFVQAYNTSPEAMRYFVVPASPVVQTLLMIVATTVLCITINNPKPGIVFEIIFIVFAVLMLPVITDMADFLQTRLTGIYSGAYTMAKYSYVQSFCSIANKLYPIAYGLSLVSCGMSICRKCTKKSFQE